MSANLMSQEIMTTKMHMKADSDEILTVGYWMHRQDTLVAVNRNRMAQPEVPTSEEIEMVMDQFEENYTGSDYCINQQVLDIINTIAVLIALAKCGIQIYTAVKFQSGVDKNRYCKAYFAYSITAIVLTALGIILYVVIRSGACACYNGMKHQTKAYLPLTITTIILTILPTTATLTLAIGGGCFQNSPLRDDPNTKTLFWVGVGLDGLLVVVIGVSLIAWRCKAGHMQMISMMQHLPLNLRYFYARTTPAIKREMLSYFLSKSKVAAATFASNPQFADMEADNQRQTSGASATTTRL